MSIIGHKVQLERLDNLIKDDKISNAYMFVGIKGIGKATIAKEFASKLLRNDKYILVEPEDGLIKVDVIRKLKEELMLKPTISERKVAIIDDAELMNEQAQNALLKILEEPPTYATIILVTSNKEKLLYTIKSRCIEFKFNPLSKEEVQSFFENPLDKSILEYCRGSIGIAQKVQNEDHQLIVEKWVEAFNKISLIDLLKDISEIKEDKFIKENIDEFLSYLLYMYYSKLKHGNYNMQEAIMIIEETRENILRNANVDIAIDRMAINLWKWGKTCKKL